LVPGKRFTKSGLYRFEEARSENTGHRKVVALEILYRIAHIEKKFKWIIVLKTRLKVVGT
jgi:hypothetical protein